MLPVILEDVRTVSISKICNRDIVAQAKIFVAVVIKIRIRNIRSFISLLLVLIGTVLVIMKWPTAMLFAPVIVNRMALNIRPINCMGRTSLLTDVNRHISDPVPAVIDHTVLITHNAIVDTNPKVLARTAHLVDILISFSAYFVMTRRWQLCTMRR